MDRYWLLTWTTYGTWLPGDKRGFVASVVDDLGDVVTHNIPGTEYDHGIPNLESHARSLLKSPPIFLIPAQGKRVLGQLQETATVRSWTLFAAAVMRAHVHVVVGVPGDPDPDSILRDFKSYASRALNRDWKRPASDTWWTESGSRRKLPDEAAVLAATAYVERQQSPLALLTANK